MAIIDGTGSLSDEKYAQEMKMSFCSQLATGLFPNTHYKRGPSIEGILIDIKAKEAVDFLTKQPRKRLMLAGYSRGGSIAVIAASMLHAVGMKVEFLFLFDPVARHASGNSSLIPANVKEAYVARRKIGAKEMEEFDDILHPGTYNPNRNFFGTTSISAAGGVNVTEAKFLGSHGAMGGVGFSNPSKRYGFDRTLAEGVDMASKFFGVGSKSTLVSQIDAKAKRLADIDTDCQAAVASFMNGGLKKAGLPGILISRTDS